MPELAPPGNLLDIGGYLNELLRGSSQLSVAGQPLTRNWSRGNAFSMDGVHPGHVPPGARRLLLPRRQLRRSERWGLHAL